MAFVHNSFTDEYVAATIAARLGLKLHLHDARDLDLSGYKRVFMTGDYGKIPRDDDTKYVIKCTESRKDGNTVYVNSWRDLLTEMDAYTDQPLNNAYAFLGLFEKSGDEDGEVIRFHLTGPRDTFQAKVDYLLDYPDKIPETLETARPYYYDNAGLIRQLVKTRSSKLSYKHGEFEVTYRLIECMRDITAYQNRMKEEFPGVDLTIVIAPRDADEDGVVRRWQFSVRSHPKSRVTALSVAKYYGGGGKTEHSAGAAIDKRTKIWFSG